MSTIGLIIQREYLTRVKKKSFIIMTILGPLLFAGIYIIPFLLIKYSNNHTTVAVLDESQYFKGKLADSKNVQYLFVNEDLGQAKQHLKNEAYNAVLYIPKEVFKDTKGVTLYAPKQAGITVVEQIEGSMEREIEKVRMQESGIDEEVLRSIRTRLDINTIKLTDAGEEEGNAGLTTIIGMIAGALIYILTVLFGVQVMRGVIEEKTNRIVEVIISSVRPFQLMMGKIIGIALVGLTQFVLWVLLSYFVSVSVGGMMANGRKAAFSQKISQTEASIDDNQVATGMHTNVSEEVDAGSELSGMFKSINSINIPLIIGCFLFYFLGGFLLYSALFAAVGSAVDSETDTQQFMLPITLPLILAFVVSQFVATSPDGPIAFWFSMIPFTSPIVMMVRLPFGVPAYELALSMVLLIAGFLFTTWLAAKIYRVGILMYGKKPSYKEIGKWLFYKE